MGIYEEIRQIGGLPAAIKSALVEVGSSLANGVGGRSRREASIEFDGRYCAVTWTDIVPELGERMFLVSYGTDRGEECFGTTHSFDEVMSSISTWLSQGPDRVGMASKFVFVTAPPPPWTAKTTDKVKARWEYFLYGPLGAEEISPLLLAHCDAELRFLQQKLGDAAVPQDFNKQKASILARRDKALNTLVPPHLVQIRAFLRLAGEVPLLRGLYPVTSLDRLFFSRCTDYPFVALPPTVGTKPDGRYYVCVKGKMQLPDASAVEALDEVLKHIPDDCGHAVEGSADDVNRMAG